MKGFMEIIMLNSHRQCEYGTDKAIYHSYGKFYEELMQLLRKKEFPSILEIGVCTGAFLHAVREFIPNAIIEGLDTDTSRFQYPYDRIHIRQGNSLDPREARGVFYDLIIDDGSHVLKDQVQTFRNFAPLIKSQGFYVVEDIISDDSRSVFEALAKEYNMTLVWHDFSSISTIPDDRLALFIRYD